MTLTCSCMQLNLSYNNLCEGKGIFGREVYTTKGIKAIAKALKVNASLTYGARPGLPFLYSVHNIGTLKSSPPQTPAHLHVITPAYTSTHGSYCVCVLQLNLSDK